MKREHEQVITKILGVRPIRLNSALVSAQNRERLYWTNISVMNAPKDKGIMLKDIAVGALKRKSQTILSTIYKENVKSMIKRKKLGLIVKECDLYRKLSTTECEYLQTVPENYTNHVSSTQRYKMLGNGWTVDIVAHIFSYIT